MKINVLLAHTMVTHEKTITKPPENRRNKKTKGKLSEHYAKTMRKLEEPYKKAKRKPQENHKKTIGKQ